MSSIHNHLKCCIKIWQCDAQSILYPLYAWTYLNLKKPWRQTATNYLVKNLKLSYLHQSLSRHKESGRISDPLWTLMLWDIFFESKIAHYGYLKKTKTRHNSSTVQAIATKFGMLTHRLYRNPIANKILNLFKIKRADGCEI